VEGIEQLFDRILLMGVVIADKQTGGGMWLFQFELAGVVGRGDQSRAGKESVKGQETARFEMFATAIEAAELVIGGQVVHEGVERNDDERIAAIQMEGRHVRVEQLRLKAERSGLGAQAREHRFKEI